MAGLGKLMATYTNSTNKLLLSEAEGEACVGELSHDATLVSGLCVEVASKLLVVHKSSMPTLAALRAQLPSLSFSRLLNDCGPSSREQPHMASCDNCAASFNSTVSMLTDNIIYAAIAVFVSVASTRADDFEWATSFYDCAWQQLHISSQGAHHFPWIVVIIGIIIGAFVTFIASLVYHKRFLQKRKTFFGDVNPVAIHKGTTEQDFDNDDSTHFVCSIGLYTFSLEEIVNATSHFSDENFLGKGEAGKVFKGILPSGQFVAVKRIDKDNKPYTFKTELVNLSKVRHAHLVTLMGFCQSNDAYYLVYEYCSNGDLSKWLFETNDDAQLLSWEQRVTVAVNIARGLWFLHNYPGGSIVHRDIKPTNILLNEHLEAKLSDFGLARHMETENSHVMTEVKGTTGYLDPEYMSMGELTQASDVYSFGIVLLQLISGRRAIDLDPNHRVSLLKTAKLIAQTGEGLQEFVDPRLRGCYSIPSMLKMFGVALACIVSYRIDRLSMKEVLQNLEHTYQLCSIYTPIHHHTLDHDECETLTPQSVRTISLESLQGF